MTTPTIYLHGFASGSQSFKVKYFAERWSGLVVPDLNQPDFQTLTVSRQVEQVQQLITEPSFIIGSSLGGLTAVILAEKYPELIKKMVLFAPAFNFTENWQKRLGQDTLSRWQSAGVLPFFHYTYNQEMLLNYHFFEDAQSYCNLDFHNTIPTLICHGIHDEIVPLSASESYAKNKDWVQLVTLDSDHGLGDHLSELLAQTQTFFWDE